MSNKRIIYLRSYRRRWALTQQELGALLGYETGSIISAMERGSREPSLKAAHGLEIIFGTAPVELFPHLHTLAERDVLARARDLYENLQGSSSNAIRTKLDFLEDLFARADARQAQCI